MGVLHSFSIKNIFYHKMGLKAFLFSYDILRFTWEYWHWSLRRCLIQIWFCILNGIHNCTVFHNTDSSWFLTHWLVLIFFAPALFFSFNLIQRDRVNFAYNTVTRQIRIWWNHIHSCASFHLPIILFLGNSFP